MDNLDDFGVQKVFLEGRPVASGGQMKIRIQEDTPVTISSVEEENTIFLDNFSTDRLELRAPIRDGAIDVLVIRHLDKYSALTESVTEKLKVKGGFVSLEDRPDLNFIAIFNRHKNNENFSVGIIANFHLDEGAVAGTVYHDSHNLALVYTNISDAAAAVDDIKNQRRYRLCQREY